MLYVCLNYILFALVLRSRYSPLDNAKELPVDPVKSDVLQGTLDLMVLKALDALGPLHGYGIARRLEQISNDLLALNEGTVYTALVRLTQKGWISSTWGASENNRKAKYYAITRSGRRQLQREMKSWDRISGVIARVLKLEREG
jgi:PadR family transcriptional regulator PadR